MALPRVEMEEDQKRRSQEKPRRKAVFPFDLNVKSQFAGAAITQTLNLPDAHVRSKKRRPSLRISTTAGQGVSAIVAEGSLRQLH